MSLALAAVLCGACGADPALRESLDRSQQEREILQEAFNAQQRRLNLLEEKIGQLELRLEERMTAMRPRRALPVRSLPPPLR